MSVLEIIGIILLIVGFVLVGIEMGIPGFGVPGISGIICLAAGVLMTAKSLETGIIMVVVIIVLLTIMMVAILY